MDRVAELIAFVLGPCLFAVLVVGGFAAVVFKWGDLGLADYIGAVSAGAGCSPSGTGSTGWRAARAGPASAAWSDWC